MPTIKVDPITLCARAQELATAAAQFDDTNASLRARIEGLGDVLSGPAPDACVRELQALPTRFVNVTETMAGYAERMTAAAREYVENEQRTQAAINKANGVHQMGTSNLAWMATGASFFLGAGGAIIAAPNIHASVYDHTLDKEPLIGMRSNARLYKNTDRMNCTYYAYGRVIEKTEHRLGESESPDGNVQHVNFKDDARNWMNIAQNNDVPSSVDATQISANSVAVFDGGTYGHVVFVESVEYENGLPTLVTFTEGNGGNRSFDGQPITIPFEKFKVLRGMDGPMTLLGYIYA